VEKAAHIEKKLKGILTNNWVVFIELLIDHRADFVASVRNHHLHRSPTGSSPRTSSS
jgi:hypothetical protein